MPYFDRTLQRRASCNAQRLVEENYTWERSVGMLEEVYRLAVERGWGDKVEGDKGMGRRR